MGITLQCHRCGKVWGYKGDNRFFATCPDCHTNVKIPDVEEYKKEMIK